MSAPRSNQRFPVDLYLWAALVGLISPALPCCPLCCSQPGALQIEQSEESDQGKYECVATNNDGTRYSAPANLYVRGRNVAPAPFARFPNTLNSLSR